MTDTVHIGVVGDFNPGYETHQHTNRALSALAGVQFTWVPTDEIRETPERLLAPFSGLLIAPSSPYRSMEGALYAIRFARERGLPLLGT